ncbi:hypothetical protein MTP99_001458 [Tenebrio molitor]|nr:hypothetical protein MTP99_001458 [Tenebrio molitor]
MTTPRGDPTSSKRRREGSESALWARIRPCSGTTPSTQTAEGPRARFHREFRHFKQAVLMFWIARVKPCSYFHNKHAPSGPHRPKETLNGKVS